MEIKSIQNSVQLFVNQLDVLKMVFKVVIEHILFHVAHFYEGFLTICACATWNNC